MNTVFITGVAGFIGFHLASFLHKRGDYVIGCDNFNDYYSPDLKKARAKELEKLGIEVICCDVQKSALLYPLFENKRFTHIIHLAAQAGVRHSLTHPHSYVDTNLSGTLHVLELCRRYMPISLIFASSSSVYGQNKDTPFAENISTDQPISLYAASKKSGELMAFSYHQLFHIPVTCLRYFTVYGPWGRPDMAYFSFASSIWEGKPISLFNEGNMKRDFTYIDDIIQGTVSAIDKPQGFAIFNLGSSCAEELMTLVSLLEERLQKKAIIHYKAMQLGDVSVTFADISKAKTLLGYCPKTSLYEGISRFGDWFLTAQQIIPKQLKLSHCPNTNF